MGFPMVLNLLKNGFPVAIFSAHMDSANVREAISQGALAADSPRQVAQASEIVMMCLPGAKISEGVVLGVDGILEGAAPGTLLLEMSTVSPETVRKFGASARLKQVKVMDAPISGGRRGAERGTLTIMVGGEKESFERCLEVFKAMGKNIYHVGGLGAGETVKLINGMVGNANLLAAVEAIDCASKAGIDLKFLQRIISTSTGQSWAWDNLIPALLDSNVVGVKLGVLLKDVNCALELAGEVGVDARMTKEGSRIIQGLIEKNGATADMSAVMVAQSGALAEGPET